MVRTEGYGRAALICFEILGSWIRVKKFHFNFSSEISEKNRFFPGTFPKNFDFFQAKLSEWPSFLVIYFKISTYPDKIVIYSQILGKLFYFAWKVITFDHTSCMFHDPFTTPTTPSPKTGSCDTPNPRIDAYGTDKTVAIFLIDYNSSDFNIYFVTKSQN